MSAPSWVAVRHDESICSAPTDERSARDLVRADPTFRYAMPLDGWKAVFGRDCWTLQYVDGGSQ